MSDTKVKGTWGGKREGAGRPKGMTAQGGARKQHQVRAYDDEWELLKRVDKLIKHGKMKEVLAFVEKQEAE